MEFVKRAVVSAALTMVGAAATRHKQGRRAAPAEKPGAFPISPA